MWAYQDIYGTLVVSHSLKKLAEKMDFDLKSATKTRDHHGKIDGYEIRDKDDRNDCEGDKERWIRKVGVVK